MANKVLYTGKIKSYQASTFPREYRVTGYSSCHDDGITVEVKTKDRMGNEAWIEASKKHSLLVLRTIIAKINEDTLMPEWRRKHDNV